MENKDKLPLHAFFIADESTDGKRKLRWVQEQQRRTTKDAQLPPGDWTRPGMGGKQDTNREHKPQKPRKMSTKVTDYVYGKIPKNYDQTRKVGAKRGRNEGAPLQAAVERRLMKGKM